MVELVHALALVPAVLWGLSPIFSKRGMAAGGSSLQASLIVVAVDSTLYLTALIVVQGGGLLANLTPAAAGLFLVAGLVGTALGRLAVFVGVDRVGATVNSAVISTRPFFAVLLAVGFLGEGLTVVTAVGVVVLVVGLVILTLSRGGDVTGWEPRDLLFPLAAAVLFGFGNVARKFGLDVFPDVTLLQAVGLNELGAMVALGAYAVAAGRTDVFRAPRRTYAYFAASGTITAAALFSLFAALRIGRVVVVDPLAATAPLFTTVFAAVLLRDLERITRLLLVGVVLTVLGVVLVVTDPSLVV